MEFLAFVVLGGLAVLASLFMVTRNNPVHAALWMLLTFFCVAGIFVQLNAEFIAAIQILVYAGAILVLYLFVVMLLNPGTKGLAKIPARTAVGALASLFILVQIFMTLGGAKLVGEPRGVLTAENLAEYGNTWILGKIMFSQYLVPFEIASVLLLLVAMIGAIVLARKED